MAPKLYMIPASPPVRSVLMVSRYIGLDLELKEVDFASGEHTKPDYLKLNPTHTVPTLDDDGFIIWESHAILPYLIEKYSKDDSLYPKELQKRTIVNQRLHFNNGTIFRCLISIIRPKIREGRKGLDKTDIDNINETYDFLESLLKRTEWIALDVPTIADYSVLATVSSLNLILPVGPRRYPKLVNWLEKCETLPGYEANKEGLQFFAGMVKKLIG